MILTLTIDKILLQIKTGTIEIEDARFKILDAINAELLNQLKSIDSKLDKALDDFNLVQEVK